MHGESFDSFSSTFKKLNHRIPTGIYTIGLPCFSSKLSLRIGLDDNEDHSVLKLEDSLEII